MTALDIGRITAEAREVKFGRILLAIIGRVLWCAGALAFHTFRILWLAIVWCGVAVKVGWQDARAAHQKRPPTT
jgi:hypothetical protein